jgi:hypothetical protein
LEDIEGLGNEDLERSPFVTNLDRRSGLDWKFKRHVVADEYVEIMLNESIQRREAVISNEKASVLVRNNLDAEASSISSHAKLLKILRKGMLTAPYTRQFCLKLQK